MTDQADSCPEGMVAVRVSCYYIDMPKKHFDPLFINYERVVFIMIRIVSL